jgi:NAD(P)-dependent dehydrogenase (short-subunit alcohol dehydrogenase family)
LGRADGKIALVTGATTGLGAAAAQLLAQEGAKVVLTTRKKLKEGQRLADEIKRKGGEAVFLKLDVSKEEDWKEVTAKLIDLFGKLNILVNNAGIGQVSDLEQLPINQWNQTMATNATGVFLGTRYGIQVMKNNGESCSIINISSSEVHINEPLCIDYNASKGAVENITKTAALHCCEKGYNIRVNAILPGAIYTNMHVEDARTQGIPIEEYAKTLVDKYCPVGRIGQPIDIAYAVLYLASDESLFVTGADLTVDGGISAK